MIHTEGGGKEKLFILRISRLSAAIMKKGGDDDDDGRRLWSI